MSVVVHAADAVALSAMSLRELETRADDILRRAEREAAKLLAGIENAKSADDSAEGPAAAARPVARLSSPTPCQQWLALCRGGRFTENTRAGGSMQRPSTT
jgi:hypothetical protein